MHCQRQNFLKQILNDSALPKALKQKQRKGLALKIYRFFVTDNQGACYKRTVDNGILPRQST